MTDNKTGILTGMDNPRIDAIRVCTETIPLTELKELGTIWYIGMIKGVVDIERKVVAFGGEYHRDALQILEKNGSSPEDVWGFNVHFDEPRESWLEYNSLINIRPHQGNKTADIADTNLQRRIAEIVNRMII